MTAKEQYNREQAFTYLGDSLAQIRDTTMLAGTLDAIARYAPNYFWEFPASTSGKYHPPKARKKRGILWHTNFAVRWGLQLWGRVKDDTDTPSRLRDEIVQALILHDLWKNGRSDKTIPAGSCDNLRWPKSPIQGITGKHGGMFAHKLLKDCLSGVNDSVAYAIGGHMGPWTEPIEDRKLFWSNRAALGPYDSCLIETVQLADYCASRYFGEDHE